MTQRTTKRIALFTMIIDHIGAFVPGAPIWLRYIGRISAPLFLFCCVESLEHTRSKYIFVFRLYIASLIMSIGNCFVHCFFLHKGDIPESNIFLTMFVGCVAVIVIEKWGFKGVALFCAYQSIIYYLCLLINDISSLKWHGVIYLWYLFPRVTGLVFTGSYGAAFVLLFILMFYAKDNQILLSALMILCSYGHYKVSHRVLSPFLRDVLDCWDMQYLMIFSLPIMLL